MKSPLTKTIFGPYGSELDKALEQKLIIIEERKQPELILTSHRFRAVTGNIILAQIDAGARAAATNTFGARALLEQDEALYQSVIKEQLVILKSALHQRKLDARRDVEVIVSAGPKGDCYNPGEAPEADEAEDFHGRQIDLILAAAREVGVPVSILFETIPRLEEGVGIAQAVKNRPGLKKAFVSFPFDIEGKPLGEQGDFERFTSEMIDIADLTRTRLGLNCGPIEGAWRALSGLSDLTEHFGILHPNASSKPHDQLDTVDGQHGLIDPEKTTQFLRYLLSFYNFEIGGGCCGYTPQNIGAITHQTVRSTQLPPTDMHPLGLAA